jgi:hypothetical protein
MKVSELEMENAAEVAPEDFSDELSDEALDRAGAQLYCVGGTIPSGR